MTGISNAELDDYKNIKTSGVSGKGNQKGLPDGEGAELVDLEGDTQLHDWLAEAQETELPQQEYFDAGLPISSDSLVRPDLYPRGIRVGQEAFPDKRSGEKMSTAKDWEQLLWTVFGDERKSTEPGSNPDILDPDEYYFVLDKKKGIDYLYSKTDSSLTTEEEQVEKVRKGYGQIVKGCNEKPRFAPREFEGEEIVNYGYFEGIGGYNRANDAVCLMTVKLNTLLEGVRTGRIDADRFAKGKTEIRALIRRQNDTGHSLRFTRRSMPEERGKNMLITEDVADYANYADCIESYLAGCGIERIRKNIGELVAGGMLMQVSDLEKRAKSLAYLAYPEEFEGYDGSYPEEDSAATGILKDIDIANYEEIARNLIPGIDGAIKRMADSLSRGLVDPMRDVLIKALINRSELTHELSYEYASEAEEEISFPDSCTYSERLIDAAIRGKELPPIEDKADELINTTYMPLEGDPRIKILASLLFPDFRSYEGAQLIRLLTVLTKGRRSDMIPVPNYGVLGDYIAKITEAKAFGFLGGTDDTSYDIEQIRSKVELAVNQNVVRGLDYAPQRAASYLDIGNFYLAMKCVEMYVYYRELAQARGLKIRNVDDLNRRLVDVFTHKSIERGIYTFTEGELARYAVHYAASPDDIVAESDSKYKIAYVGFLREVSLIWDILQDCNLSGNLSLVGPIESFAANHGINIEKISDRKLMGVEPAVSLNRMVFGTAESTK